MLTKQLTMLKLSAIITLNMLVSVVCLAQTSAIITPIQWPEKITPEMLLGKALFFDKRISKNASLSCASCHLFEHGGSDTLSHSLRFDNTYTTFNTPSIFNVINGYKVGWIGRLYSTQSHLDDFFTSPVEMGNNWQEIIQVIKNDSEYSRMFSQSYSQGVTKETISAAILAYEEALTTPSDFDKYLRGDDSAISEQAKQGFEVFKRFGCASCHQGQNLGGNVLQKIGAILPYNAGNLVPDSAELGRYLLTRRALDIQVFRVPSLRNVSLTAPYFHDGSVSTLKGAIRLMVKHQLGRSITGREIGLMIAFLKTLNGTPHPELMP
ncbi:cytochrome c peroxidase [Gammaproteobacteria bacterium AS21]